MKTFDFLIALIDRDYSATWNLLPCNLGIEVKVTPKGDRDTYIIKNISGGKLPIREENGKLVYRFDNFKQIEAFKRRGL